MLGIELGISFDCQAISSLDHFFSLLSYIIIYVVVYNYIIYDYID
jgi:hypothetical protein